LLEPHAEAIERLQGEARFAARVVGQLHIDLGQRAAVAVRHERLPVAERGVDEQPARRGAQPLRIQRHHDMTPLLFAPGQQHEQRGEQGHGSTE
jgi:hypothetical protein